MNRKLKVVMVGAGDRANQVIYPAFNSLDYVDMIGICDIDANRLNTTADRYNIARRYGEGGVFDYQKMMIELEPDAAVVVGQPHIMYDIWKWCLEKKINLYIEKPFALSIHQARSLETIAKRNHCVTQVSFQRRYTPMVKLLREKCLERGDIVHALCKFYKCQISDFFGARDHMMDDCVHSIDTLRWICGGDVECMESDVKRIGTSDINFISAALHFSNGANGYLINSWSSGKRIFAVEIHAPSIYAEAEHEGKGYLYKDGDTKGIEYDAKAVAGSDDLFIYTGVQASAADFSLACLNGSQPACNFSDALKTMDVAEKILAMALLNGK